jgi:hypothetical protein
MQTQYHDRTSSSRQGRRLLLRLVAIGAAAFALVAASVSAAPPALKTSAAQPAATAAATTTCAAQILKNGKLTPVYERYYKYAFKKVKGKKSAYRKVIVRARRKLQTTCARQCVRTKAKKQKKYKYKTVTVRGKKVRKRVGKPKTVTVRVPVYKSVKKTVIVKKGNRLVKVKKKVLVYVFEKCPTNSNSSSGTPVKIKILDGSQAVLDFGAFIRNAKLSGDLSGFIPGGYKLNQDNQINLTRGAIALGVTDVFIDDDCGGQVSAAIRTNAASGVGLDPTRNSTSTVLATGTVTATAYTRIKLALDLRNDDSGCNQPYISTGYQEFAKTFFLKGKIEKATGLNKLSLNSAPDPLDVEACLSAGTPTSPCNGFAIPLPIIVSVKLLVSVQIGGTA